MVTSSSSYADRGYQAKQSNRRKVEVIKIEKVQNQSLVSAEQKVQRSRTPTKNSSNGKKQVIVAGAPGLSQEQAESVAAFQKEQGGVSVKKTDKGYTFTGINEPTTIRPGEAVYYNIDEAGSQKATIYTATPGKTKSTYTPKELTIDLTPQPYTQDTIKPGEPVYFPIEDYGRGSRIYKKQGDKFKETNLIMDTSLISSQAVETDIAQRQDIVNTQLFGLKTRQVNPFREQSQKNLSKLSSEERARLKEAPPFLQAIGDLSYAYVERPVFGAGEVGYKALGNTILGEKARGKPGSYLYDLETIRTEPWSTTIKRGEVQEAAIAGGLILLTGGSGTLSRGARTGLGIGFVGKGTYGFLTAKTRREKYFSLGEVGLGVLAVPKEFRPVKYAKTSLGETGKIESVGFDFGTRSREIVSRLKTTEGTEIKFFGREFTNKIKPEAFESPVNFPETSLGGKAYLKALDVPSERKIGAKSLIEAGRILRSDTGISVTDYVTRVEGIQNRELVSREVELLTYNKLFGIKIKNTGRLFGTEPTNPMLPKDFGNIKSGDIDVYFPRTGVKKIGRKLGRTTERLNIIEGTGDFVFKAEENAIYKGEKKFLEAKSGVNQELLGLGDTAPGRVGGLSMNWKAVKFGKTKALPAGQQFVRKISGSLITSPGGKGSGETPSFSKPGILGKNVAENPRGIKDVADAFSTGYGLVELRKLSPKAKVQLGGVRAKSALDKAFENLYTKEQQFDILAKRSERTGAKFEIETRRGLLDVKSPSLSSASLFKSAVSGSVSSKSISSASSVSSSSVFSPSSISSSISSSSLSKSLSPRSPSPKSPSPSPSYFFGSPSPRSPSPKSPSPYSPYSPKPSTIISPSPGGGGGDLGSGGGFGFFDKPKKRRLGEPGVYVLPDLASVSATEQESFRRFGGGEAVAPRLTKDIYSKALRAYKGIGGGFIPTEQMRTRRLKI